MCDFLLINCYHVHICIFNQYATQSQLVDHQVLPDTGLKSKVTQCKKYTYMLLKNPQKTHKIHIYTVKESSNSCWSFICSARRTSAPCLVFTSTGLRSSSTWPKRQSSSVKPTGGKIDIKEEPALQKNLTLQFRFLYLGNCWPFWHPPSLIVKVRTIFWGCLWLLKMCWSASMGASLFLGSLPTLPFFLLSSKTRYDKNRLR